MLKEVKEKLNGKHIANEITALSNSCYEFSAYEMQIYSTTLLLGCECEGFFKPTHLLMPMNSKQE